MLFLVFLDLHQVKIMNIIDSLNWRYATKEFDTTKIISQEKINVLTEAVNLTASSYGMQPFKIILVKDQELKNKLAEASYGQINVSTASHLLIFAAQTDINKDFINSYVKIIAETRKVEIESLSAFKKMLEDYIDNKTPEQVAKWASDQANIALGNLLTVCAVEEIDACPMGGFQPEKFDDILNLKEQNLKSIVFATLGYRSKNDKYADFAKVRKPLNEILIEY